MFTGLVEVLCQVSDVQPLDSTTSGGDGYSLTISKAATILDDCSIGDSIAVNGTCLTVTEFDNDSFKIGAAPETLKRTNLGKLKVGDVVNCERAMKGEKRFGGHFVQGHVDTTATLRSVVPNGNALTLTLRLTHSPDLLPLPSSLSPYLIEKGYVTLDGASLTLIDVSPPQGGSLPTAGELREDIPKTGQKEIVEFTVMLIKHTQDVIGLSKKKPGELVNVEFDMVGKYMHRSIQIAATQSLQGDAQDSQPTVDAGGKAVKEDAGDNDTLIRLIRREVRRALVEEGVTK